MKFTLLSLIPLALGGLPYQPYSVGQYQQTRSQIGQYNQPTGNFIQQTRYQADSVKRTIKDLSANPIAGKYINRLISNSKCLNNDNDAIQAIESGTQMVENARAEINQLIATVKSMENKKDTIELVK